MGTTECNCQEEKILLYSALVGTFGIEKVKKNSNGFIVIGAMEDEIAKFKIKIKDDSKYPVIEIIRLYIKEPGSGSYMSLGSSLAKVMSIFYNTKFQKQWQNQIELLEQQKGDKGTYDFADFGDSVDRFTGSFSDVNTYGNLKAVTFVVDFFSPLG